MTADDTALPHSGLDEAYYDTMAEHATTHWWYLARAAWVTQELRGQAPGGTALDVGCGAGASLRALDAAGFGRVVGFDLSAYVLDQARRLVGVSSLAVASASELPVAAGSIEAIVSLDVLEHLPDDLAALREYRRVARPGAHLLVTTPAYRWLYSDHDRWAGHERRYSARGLEAVVREAGFEVERVTHLFSFLVPAAVVLRLSPLRRWLGRTDEKVSSVSPRLNRLLASVARLERRAGRALRIPFGLTVLVVARAPDGKGDPAREPGARGSRRGGR